METKKSYFIYKIYYSTGAGEEELVYIGKSNQPLEERLCRQFFQEPKSRLLDIGRVSRMEYIPFHTRADMLVAECILVNRYKPRLNRDRIAGDALTLSLPDLPAMPYECAPMELWKREIRERDAAFETLERKRAELFEAHRNKRREIFSQAELPAEEKAKRWTTWLVTHYEPAMERLNREEVMSW